MLMDDEAEARRQVTDAGRAVVLYDRDCGFCVWSLAWLLAWDRDHRLRPLALQEETARAMLSGMDREQMLASAHLVTPAGAVHSGGDAVEPILRLLPGGVRLAPVARAMTGASRVGYNWVARNRGPLGRPVGEAAKARAIARIDRH
jgi:predicted DCC family thiol-disulfide oxidoreductase YuxK